MKKQIIFLLAIALLVFPQISFAKSKIEQAKELVFIGKDYAAIEMINQAIVDDPLNAKLHYEAGVLFLNLGQSRDFDLAMKNSCQLNKSSCNKVAEFYYAIAFNSLDAQRKEQSSIRAFQKAFSYNHSKKQEALARLFESGQDWLARGSIETAEIHFYVLTSLEPSFKTKIAEIYYNKALNSSSDGTILLLQKSTQYSIAYKKQAGEKLAEMAKNNKYPEKEKNAFKREAGKYLSQSEMLAHFPPDYREFKLNVDYNVTFSKPGESNGFYIRQPMGTPSKRFATSFKTKVKAVLRDGREFDLAVDEQMPNGDYDFKLVSYGSNTKALVWFQK